jgi:hypothetical protein
MYLSIRKADNRRLPAEGHVYTNMTKFASDFTSTEPHFTFLYYFGSKTMRKDSLWLIYTKFLRMQKKYKVQ